MELSKATDIARHRPIEGGCGRAPGESGRNRLYIFKGTLSRHAGYFSGDRKQKSVSRGRVTCWPTMHALSQRAVGIKTRKGSGSQ